MHRSKLLFPATLLITVILGLSGIILMAGTEDAVPAVSTAAGKIDTGPRPIGSIAFIKDGGIWIMDSDGKNRRIVCAVNNAKGRLSFSPDNKRIAFTREGSDVSKLPSDEGGGHKLYDVFLAFVDSATTNTNWWNRVTFGLGAAYPDWSDNDSMIYFQNDINAGFVDYLSPSYQLGKASTTDGHAEYFRRDWQTCATNMLTPTVTRDGKKIAYVINYSVNPEKLNFQNFGVKIVDIGKIGSPETEMRKASPGLEKAIAPQWSPDGRWLAYLNNDMRNPGIYIIKSDLSETRLVFAPTPTQQLTANPANWAPNSKWLTFATADGVIYTIDINGEHLTPVSGTGVHSNPTWSR